MSEDEKPAPEVPTPQPGVKPGLLLLQVEGICRVYLPDQDEMAHADARLLGAVLVACPVVADYRYPRKRMPKVRTPEDR
jgi:hypothetical protein